MQEESTSEHTEERQGDEEQAGASGAEEKTREDEETSGAAGSDDSDDSGMTDIEKEKDARKEIQALEGDPPQDLSDWPTGKAKYETFGGAEHESSYDEAATSELGPSDVRHREDGTVEVHGEAVDNPEDYKNDPIPGGPTDPNTPTGAGETDLSKKSSTVDSEGGSEGGESGDSDDSAESSGSGESQAQRS